MAHWLLLTDVHVGVVRQFAMDVQLVQTISERDVHTLETNLPLRQEEHPVQLVCPLFAEKVLLGQVVQDTEPALAEKVPLGQAEHEDEPALAEKVPLGQMVQPHRLTLETPTFGFELYL